MLCLLSLACIADGDALLNSQERAALSSEMIELDDLMHETDGSRLKQATEKLGRASEEFAARRMDRSIQQALSGVSLEELDQEVSE